MIDIANDQPAQTVAVIGATGSVGSAALDVCRAFKDRFKITALAAAKNADKLFDLCVEFGAKRASLMECSNEDRKKFADRGVDLNCGKDGLKAIVDSADHIVFASSGTDAIHALRYAADANKDISLANKESIVASGAFIMPHIKRADQLRPVDSEHSAIWQALRGEPTSSVSAIYLTASGGPFREMPIEQMKSIAPKDALRHPTWKMGAKITVDSATLMNKGIECIEASQLFSLPPKKVRAIIHPDSLVHGMILFLDTTIKMIVSPADMRLPCAAALAHPHRLDLEFAGYPSIDLDGASLAFFEPDRSRFRCLAIAEDVMHRGGAYPPVMIGADEAAVAAFLDGRISFLQIADVIDETLASFSGSSPKDIDESIELIAIGQRVAEEQISKIGRRA